MFYNIYLIKKSCILVNLRLLGTVSHWNVCLHEWLVKRTLHIYSDYLSIIVFIFSTEYHIESNSNFEIFFNISLSFYLQFILIFEMNFTIYLTCKSRKIGLCSIFFQNFLENYCFNGWYDFESWYLNIKKEH